MEGVTPVRTRLESPRARQRRRLASRVALEDGESPRTKQRSDTIPAVGLERMSVGRLGEHEVEGVARRQKTPDRGGGALRAQPDLPLRRRDAREPPPQRPRVRLP